MEDTFANLQNKDYFTGRVVSFFEQIPADIDDILQCTATVCPDLVSQAHDQYILNINYFAERVKSNDPDHYKRSGALLHALYKARAIVSVDYGLDYEEVENGGGPVDVHHIDIASSLSAIKFYNRFHNEWAAFGFAYECCLQYEAKDPVIDTDYLHTIFAYMRQDNEISVDSFYMIFRSLMLA